MAKKLRTVDLAKMIYNILLVLWFILVPSYGNYGFLHRYVGFFFFGFFFFLHFFNTVF